MSGAHYGQVRKKEEGTKKSKEQRENKEES